VGGIDNESTRSPFRPILFSIIRGGQMTLLILARQSYSSLNDDH